MLLWVKRLAVNALMFLHRFMVIMTWTVGIAALGLAILTGALIERMRVRQDMLGDILELLSYSIPGVVIAVIFATALWWLGYFFVLQAEKVHASLPAQELQIETEVPVTAIIGLNRLTHPWIPRVKLWQVAEPPSSSTPTDDRRVEPDMIARSSLRLFTGQVQSMN